MIPELRLDWSTFDGGWAMGDLNVLALVAAGIARPQWPHREAELATSKDLGLFGATFVMHLLATVILAMLVLLAGISDNLAGITR